MDDKQLAMVLTALSDQTAAMNRMADALTGILLHLNPKAAAKMAAPGYMRPLAAYASFDWRSIDADVIAFDRHGATEVEHNGVAYRRYRSNDDDPKGVDIRFRRVVAGTPEGKDMVWGTLIKFADKRAKDAPRPLRGELAEKIEQAQSAGSAATAAASVTIQPPTAISVTSWPTTPAPQPVPVVAPPTVETEPLISAGEQVKVNLVAAAARARSMRDANQIIRNHVYLALKAASGGELAMHRVIEFVFGRTTSKGLTSAEVWALHGWLKPVNGADGIVPANPNILADINTILQDVVVPA